MLKACRDAPRIGREDTRGEPQLLGHIGDQCSGRILAHTQDPAGIAHDAELNRIAELIVRSPADFGLEAILRRQSVVPDQTFLIVWNTEQGLAFVKS